MVVVLVRVLVTVVLVLVRVVLAVVPVVVAWVCECMGVRCVGHAQQVS